MLACLSFGGLEGSRSLSRRRCRGCGDGALRALPWFRSRGFLARRGTLFGWLTGLRKRLSASRLGVVLTGGFLQGVLEFRLLVVWDSSVELIGDLSD